MAQNTTIPKSLVAQILDDMFANLDAHQEFDVQTVQRLRELARRGSLRRADQVTKAIEAARQGVDEA